MSSLPPHSLETERAVLGAFLLERGSLSQAVEILRPSDFYKDGHRIIFAAMRALFGRDEPVDLLTLAEELRRQGMLSRPEARRRLGRWSRTPRSRCTC